MGSSMPDVISSQTGARLRSITSRQNALVKELRHAFSQGQAIDGLCPVEGIRLIEEAIRSRLKVHALFVRESARAKAERILDQVSKHADLVLLPDTVFDSAVITEHPQGIAALVKVQEHDFDSALRLTSALVVVAAGIQDPGNLGTIIRSAEAFGASAVLTTEGSVNHWNPKVVRASAGSMFRMPVLKAATEELIQQLRAREIRLLALVAPHENGSYGDGSASRSPRLLFEADLTSACAFLVGNEGAGLSRELTRNVDEFIAIPQTHVESLNAGIAASIALYEAQRQRSASR